MRLSHIIPGRLDTCLQLYRLILCKCDPPSIRRLLLLIPELRDLFYCYPETCIRDILDQFPQPIHNLLRASYALHDVAVAKFDPHRTLELLEKVDITRDWCALYPRVLRLGDDPVAALEQLLGLEDDVSTAVDLYAQSINASVEMLSNPFARAQPISLSTTEYIRLASTFLMLNIFHQLRDMFNHHGEPNSFMPAFLRHLAPWQLEQGLSVESFFQRVISTRWFGPPPPLQLSYKFRRSFCIDPTFATSAYIQNYLEIIDGMSGYLYDPPGPGPLSFGQAIRAHQRCPRNAWDCLPHLPAPRFEVVHCHSRHNHLHSHGWAYFEQCHSNGEVAAREYTRFFLELGFFFWDKERLDHWGIADPDEFPRAMLMLKETIEAVKRAW
ncbi:hypothetical protein K491DRAFT_490266 [Lophiostoma macrostomum CBS 122681]|uniref:Uncharacterized protein n=1 Tax=Lophiostoma macrostomum CBS 122681 TaxID=1314788 RepID=A0A6A6T412_9PLEO|nr:hypothetical protein K491DRAFT_490266 [Lophiostoma macrostomum CBS 122681]